MANGTIVALIGDLMFGSKVQAAVIQSGFEYRSVRDLETLREALPEARHVVINLANVKNAELPFEALEVVLAAKTPVICYVPHVEEHLAERARKLGAPIVVPRGSLIDELQRLGHL